MSRVDRTSSPDQALHEVHYKPLSFTSAHLEPIQATPARDPQLY